MGREKICIDSCVFFHMMRYNDAYEQQGFKSLIQTISADEDRYNRAVRDLERFMQPFVEAQEKKQGKKFSFLKKLSVVTGFMKGNNPNIPEEAKAMFSTLNGEYAASKSHAHVGRLYLKYLDRGVEFYVTPTTVDEIRLHRQLAFDKEQNPTPAPETKKKGHKEEFASASIDRMMQNCSPIVFETDREREYITKLSEVLRGKRELPRLKGLQAAMKGSVNQNGVYGDSLIMAESALAGLPLVTQNEKDFIFDKGHMFDKNGKFLTTRRDIIKKIIKELGLSSDAGPLSVEEFLNKTDDTMILERVLTMDPETAAEIFGWAKPKQKKHEEEPDRSAIKKEQEELYYQEMLARQRKEKERKAREQEDEDGLCL